MPWQYYQGNWGAIIAEETDVATWLECTASCTAEPTCETVTYSLFSNNCKLYGYASPIDDATTSANAGLYVSGRICSNEITCLNRACESCALMGATMERGCRYDINDQLAAPTIIENVLTYYDCVQNCRQTATCTGITFYSRSYSIVPSDNEGAPMRCLLHQSSLGALTCDSTTYQTVTSGRFCEDETKCTSQVIKLKI